MADSSIPEKLVAACLAYIRELRAQLAQFEPGGVNEILGRRAEESTITPEDTLRRAETNGSSRSEAQYQRRMSSLLAGRP